MGAEPLSQQRSLFGGGEPRIDAVFNGLRRTRLEHGAWFDLCPGWLSGDAAVFDELLAHAEWREEARVMYQRVVDVPRLCAVSANAEKLHPVLLSMRRALDARYDTSFERLSFGLYRDGRDSVAWHGDYIARRLPNALVATVSVGAPRRFMLRRRGGGRALAFSLGAGDLLVMGGTCQRTYEHCVPKVAQAAPRIAVMYRPKWRED